MQFDEAERLLGASDDAGIQFWGGLFSRGVCIVVHG
jgi:hypothetical protein